MFYEPFLMQETGISLMRIKKPPFSQLRKSEQGYNFYFMSKKDFQKRTYKTMNKGQYNKDKARTRKPKYTDLQYEKQ
jgi:hypothetical protein